MNGKDDNGLSPADAELWARITRGVRPLRESGEVAARPSSDRRETRARTGKDTRHPPPRAGQSSPRPAPSSSTGQPPQPRPHRAPPGGTLNRRERQRMARGKVEIEARMDLHGLGVEAAHTALRAFIIDSRRRGMRTVLVITGKGKAPFARHTLHGQDYWHAPERAGKLRQLLPRWLAEAGIAEHVAGWQPAHPRHGGGGAFYIRLRRARG